MLLFASWWLVGMVVSIAGWLGWIYPPLSILLILPILVLVRALPVFWAEVKVGGSWQIFLVVSLVAVWLVHLAGVFVPETGFDAVWYHLPVAYQFASQHSFSYLPEIYQSLNPYFSDGIFLLGFQVGGELGVKAVAYLLGLSLLLVSMKLARFFLNKNWTLIFGLSISLMQVVTWQVSSFHVDVAKAFWEVSLLLILVEIIYIKSKRLKKLWLFGGAMAFGASLGTKVFSILLVPVVLLIVWLVSQSLVVSLLFLTGSILVAASFYFNAYLQTGDPLISVSLHLGKLSQIGGQSSLIVYTWERAKNIFTSPFLAITSRDYINPLSVLLSPFLFSSFVRKKISRFSPIWILLIWSGASWLVWWFVPPLSSRYAISGFVSLLIVTFWATSNFVNKNKSWKKPIFLAMIVINLALLLPRGVVLRRQLNYLLFNQTRENYVQQFMDGNIDQHLKSWHKLD